MAKTPAVEKFKKEVDIKIKELKQMVSQNIGALILTVRSSSERGRGCFASTITNYYIETGRISGDLEVDLNCEQYDHVNFPKGSLNYHGGCELHMYMRELNIPVHDKLIGESMTVPSPACCLDDLLQVEEKGYVGFDRLEFVGRVLDSYMPVDCSRASFNLYIGEEEVREVMRGNHPETIDSFFEMYKNKGGVNQAVKKLQKGLRKSRTEDLFEAVLQLVSINGALDTETDSIIRAINTDEHYDRVHTFRSWNEQAGEAAEKVKSIISNESLKWSDQGSIDFKPMGVPLTMRPEDYFRYLNKRLIPQVQKKLSKIKKVFEKKSK
ncbi:hypothetical protein GOV14_04980 [Candidatus Pacearchaeota archaeon]|nr:hypothetical protein [Candidatus Pacearchaeota archaeon]